MTIKPSVIENKPPQKGTKVPSGNYSEFWRIIEASYSPKELHNYSAASRLLAMNYVKGSK